MMRTEQSTDRKENNLPTSIEDCRYYDHVSNVGAVDPAAAEAMSRVRADVFEAGEAWTVIAAWPGKTPFYWNGGRYDAINLAKSLDFNGAAVRLLTSSGDEIEDIAGARY